LGFYTGILFLGGCFRRETSRRNKQKKKLVNEMWVELGPRTNFFSRLFSSIFATNL
jgi:hypothetical protein